MILSNRTLKCHAVEWFTVQGHPSGPLFKTLVECVTQDGQYVTYVRTHTSKGDAKRAYFDMGNKFLGETFDPTTYGYTLLV